MEFVSYKEQGDNLQGDGYLYPVKEVKQYGDENEVKYYKFHEFSTPIYTIKGNIISNNLQQKKYDLYTDFNDIKIIQSVSSNFAKDVNYEEFVPDFEVDDILLQNYRFINIDRAIWKDRLENLRVFKKLTEREKKEYQKISLVKNAKSMPIKAIPLLSSIGVGTTVFSITQGGDLNTLLYTLVSAGLSWNVCMLILQNKLQCIFEEELKIKENKKLIQTEIKNINNDLSLSIYYNILLEAIRKRPNIENIRKLNEERKELFNEKEDDFSKSVDNFVRVR